MLQNGTVPPVTSVIDGASSPAEVEKVRVAAALTCSPNAEVTLHGV